MISFSFGTASWLAVKGKDELSDSNSWHSAFEMYVFFPSLSANLLNLSMCGDSEPFSVLLFVLEAGDNA